MKNAPKAFKRYTVTAALPYANGPQHLGHLAGAYLPADIYVRYLRRRERDVVFICGSDEHGAAINLQARKEGITPREVVDKYHFIIKKALEDFGIEFDIYSRTSNETHHKTAQDFFLKFYNEGKLIEKTSEQLYDSEANFFLADRFVTGTCPKCGYEKAYGDQCENCGSSLNASDLINPKSTLSGSVPVMKETTHWYFPLDQYQERLEKYILEDHKEWKANVYGQCKSWLKEGDGLQPRSITRDLEWGVQVPVEAGKGKVLYVWFDAPIGYISATKEWAEQQRKEGKDVDWETYWKKDDDTALVHFIGKDNIVFHCIVFPAMLMGHGGFNLPYNVPANEFLNLQGEKFSTSRNYAVWAHEFIKDFPDQVEVMRYVLASIMPEQKDSDFSWAEFQARNNNELADILGNLIRRVIVLTHKYYEGEVPDVSLGETEIKLLADAREKLRLVGEKIEIYRFRDALQEAMNIARIGNKFLTETEPWKLVKTDPERVKKIMRFCLELSAILAVAFDPFMPKTAEKINNMLNKGLPSWEQALNEPLFESGHIVNEPGILFVKIEDEVVAEQVEKLKANLAANAAQAPAKIAAAKSETSFDDFQKMDIRVATILEAEKVPKTDKLLKLTVDTGFDKRTVVSGVAEFFKPEELIGKQALLLANLPPRKIRGVESQGMLLFAEDKEGKLHLVSPTDQINNGSTVN